MLNRLSELWAKWGTEGLKLPHLHVPGAVIADAKALFVYLSFLTALGSIIALHFFPALIEATGVSIGFYVICTALSLFKELNKLKFDAKNKSLELEDEEGAK